MWLVYSSNKFSEWVQIFQKNLFQEEPMLGGFKLNVRGPPAAGGDQVCMMTVWLQYSVWEEGGRGGGDHSLCDRNHSIPTTLADYASLKCVQEH